MEHVLRLYNRTTRELIQPRCILTWARTLVANRRAVDGPSWVKWFSPFNSGTINNQWNLDLISKMSSDQNPGWFGYIGYYITEVYRDYFISHYKDPYLSTSIRYNGMA